MIVHLSADQIRTVDEMRAFVEGTELADIGHLDRGGAYALISWALERGCAAHASARLTGRGQALPGERNGPLPGPKHPPHRSAPPERPQP